MAHYPVELGDTEVAFIVVTQESAPIEPDSVPTVLMWGPDGTMTNGSLSSSLANSGNVSGAANNGAGLIRITTAAAHNLRTGMRVTITGVGGTTEANATWTVTVITTTTFDLQTSTFTNTYTSGGTWSQTGLYKYSNNFTAANGYEAGQTYRGVISTVIGGESIPCDNDTFTVY